MKLEMTFIYAVLLVALVVGSEAVTKEQVQQTLDQFVKKMNTLALETVHDIEPSVAHEIVEYSRNTIHDRSLEILEESEMKADILDELMIGYSKEEYLNMFKCIETGRNRLNDITLSSESDLRKCHLAFSNATKTNLRTVAAKFANITQEVQQLQTTLDKCSSGDAGCINGLVTQMEKMDKELPKVFEDWTEHSSTYVLEKPIEAIEDCAHAVVCDMKNKGSALIVEILSNCISKTK